MLPFLPLAAGEGESTDSLWTSRSRPGTSAQYCEFHPKINRPRAGGQGHEGGAQCTAAPTPPQAPEHPQGGSELLREPPALLPCDCITYTGINKGRFYLNKYQVYGLYNIHIMPLSPGSGLVAREDSHVVLFHVVRLRGEFGRSRAAPVVAHADGAAAVASGPPEVAR